MQHARRPRRSRRTSSSCAPARPRAALVRLRCCRFPGGRRRSNVSAPPTVRAHSGWPPSYPTCGTAWSARLRTIRVRTGAKAAPVLYEPVPFVRGSAADLFLNGIQSCDSFQSLAGDGRCVRLLQIVELAPDVRPTGDLLNAAILFIELVESSVGVGLQRAPKRAQMLLGMFALAQCVADAELHGGHRSLPGS